MSELRWTTERPTVPGYYWIQSATRQEPEVVEVWGDAGRIVVSEIGSGVMFTVDELDESEWCGPLTPPPGRGE